MRGRVATPTALLVAAAIILSGCASAGGRSAREIVVTAAAATRDAATSRVAVTIEPEAPEGSTDAGAPLPGAFSGEGVWDYERNIGRLRMEMPRNDGQPPAEMETLVLEDAVYQRYPPELRQLTGAKTWLKLAVGDLPRLASVNAASASSAESSDPTRALAMLRGASDDVREVGKETLRGVTVTHYRLTVDLQKAVDQAPADQQASIRSFMSRAGLRESEIEVWVDDDDRLRKLVQYSPAGEGARLKVTTELYDFGTAVDVEAPPADEVGDLSQLFGSLGNLGNLMGTTTTSTP